jgi:AmmeMemoRadiSam system protein B/AmmeMemoRadiSam system protein A
MKAKIQLHIFRNGVLILFLCMLIQNSTAQKVREPAQAGRYYPGSKRELTEMIQGFLNTAERTHISGQITGIWVPHAGYMFSGQIAANAYKLVQGSDFESVIILGPSHYTHLDCASIGTWNAYRTPLGEAQVDTQLVNTLRSDAALIANIPEAHRYEHSVEVQIPFIQTVLPGVPIVPIVVHGDLPYDRCQALAAILVKAIAGRKVLLVASSDMSHFPSYKDAYDVDLRILDAVDAFDTRKIYRLKDSLLQKKIPNLDCAMCGPGALLTVMLASKQLKADESTLLPYANSGDLTGERGRVVGYGAAVFYNKSNKTRHGEEIKMEDIPFSVEERNRLFRIARESIDSALQGKRTKEFSVGEPNLLLKRGVFVTLMNHDRLRGCIGHFEADMPLYQIVSQMAVAASTQDPRFAYNPITVQEMGEIDIKISILSEMKKIDSIDEIEIGKHGIYIRQNGRRGTYLPEVATEQGWNKIEFLEHCCMEKAGLPRDAWKKDADIFIYSSQILSEIE